MFTCRPHLPAGLLFAAAAGLGVLSAEESEKFAIPPRVVKLDLPHSKLGTVAAALGKQGGLAIAFPPAAADEPCDGVFNEKPVWDALEQLAGQTGTRIVLHDAGRRVALEPRGKSDEVSDVCGPFRVVARQVVGRRLLDTGDTFYDVQLEAHWEPRVPVFRIDAQPRIVKAADDRGTALTAAASGARSQPTGATHAATARLTGLTRESKRIAVLRGEFAVTASEKMLAFRFADLSGKAPIAAAPPEKGAKVAAALTRVEKDEQTWEVGVELTYPPGLPTFESFEAGAWTAGNRLRLVSPAGKSFAPTDYELDTRGSTVVAAYRFKEDAAKGLVNVRAKGWTAVYDAPSPPVEFAVPFELKNIPLP